MFNIDFYPTPNSLIKKLIEDIKIQEITAMLEPSVGKGNIVDYIQNKANSNNRYNKIKLDIDCIEIDDNLRYLAKGKGYRIVHDDFLTYDTYKKYSHIIANFPFSEGDKHLKKAIDMLELSGGKLRCIVNAETIKNPYSNLRKDIIQKLNKYNAKIEFLQDEFLEAERKTAVEIALIRCDVEVKEVGSIILDKLQEAEQQKEQNYNTNYVVENDFMKAIIKQFQFECNAGINLINEYEKLKSFTASDFAKSDKSILKLQIANDNSYLQPTSNQLCNDYIKCLRAKYWNTLFERKEFIGLFTSNLLRDFRNNVGELANYDFNEFNIKELKRQMSLQLSAGVKATILELFEEFSHKHYWDKNQSSNIHYFNGWKTNKAWKINKKVIIPLSAFSDWDGKFEPFRYKCFDKLLDIEKVFNYLDTGNTSELNLREIVTQAQKDKQTKNIITKFFKIDFYKKGTTHLTFLDDELLKKFNVFGSLEKGWLMPGYGKRKYEEMSDEEKSVVDSFEGQKEYQKVVNNTDYYLYDSTKILMLN